MRPAVRRQTEVLKGLNVPWNERNSGSRAEKTKKTGKINKNLLEKKNDNIFLNAFPYN